MICFFIKHARKAALACALGLAAACLFQGPGFEAAETPASMPSGSSSVDLRFDTTISRQVLENYLSRAITMEGLLSGRGDLDDNVRMLRQIGAKFIGRSLCLWGGEAHVLANLERATDQLKRVRAADSDMILQACIFEIVTRQVDQVPVPEWAFVALGQPVEKRNFRYADMLYPDGKFNNHWGAGQSVPDVSRPETQLWFYFLAVSFINTGCEAIHFGQTELMNHNDRNLVHYARLLALIRSYATGHARRHLVLCDSHVPSGGLVYEGKLLMDFHSFPLRIMELPDKPQEAILKVGFSDGIYGRSKGGRTYSGWDCEHLPYLVEIDNWGVSRQPGQPKAGSIWIWGYDEITWFAHQSREYRSNWLAYAWDWVRRTDTNGHLQMPGSRTLASPVERQHWYYANHPSPSVPDGFGDEAAIRAIWARDVPQSGVPPSPSSADAADVVGNTISPWQPGRLDIHQISTGRGNAGLYILPDGTTLLVDAGEISTKTAQHTPDRPNGTRAAGEWISRYIRHALAHDPHPVLDYVLVTHFHDDHMGGPSETSPAASCGAYRLAGVTQVGESFKVGKLLDRGWPDYSYPKPLDDVATKNYVAFVRWQAEHNRLKVERFVPGRSDQVVLCRDTKTYPDFQFRNVGANGEIWTGQDTSTHRCFPPLETIPQAQWPHENMCSISFRLSYGQFDYFNGGDVPGVHSAAEPSWHDVETPVARAVGPVEAAILDHHGYVDSQNEFLVATLRPCVWTLSVWDAHHPTAGVWKRLMSTQLNPGARDVFATDLHPENRKAIGNIDKLASNSGHIVLRVAPGGGSFRVVIVDDKSESHRITKIFGPYPSR